MTVEELIDLLKGQIPSAMVICDGGNARDSGSVKSVVYDMNTKIVTIYY